MRYGKNAKGEFIVDCKEIGNKTFFTVSFNTWCYNKWTSEGCHECLLDWDEDAHPDFQYVGTFQSGTILYLKDETPM